VNKIELIYDRNCPNVEATRKNLRIALQQSGLGMDWQEWDRESSTCPDYAKNYGSPTILVDGRDIVGDSPSDGNSCRVYPNDDDGLAGIPSVELVIASFKS
jgi:hypothetical protein